MSEHETHQPLSSSVHEEVEEGEPWLVSYADMMTLLFGFFVLMYSFAVSKVEDNSENWIKVKKELAAFFGGDAGKARKEETFDDSRELFVPVIGVDSSRKSGSKTKNTGIFDDAMTDKKNKKSGEDDFNLSGTYVSSTEDFSKTEVGGALQLKKIVDSENSLELIISSSMFFSGESANLAPNAEKLLTMICDKISTLKFPYYLGVSAFSQKDTDLSQKTKIAAKRIPSVPSLETIQRAQIILQKLSSCQSKESQGSRMMAAGVGYIPLSQNLKGVLKSGIVIRLNVAVDF